MSDTRFIITTSLEGYINALVPSGKFNNCTIGFRIPEEELPKFDAAYEQALEWGKNKMAGKRFSAELPKWDVPSTERIYVTKDGSTIVKLKLDDLYKNGEIVLGIIKSNQVNKEDN